MDLSKTIHLAIDVQNEVMGQLSGERQETFPQQVRDFSDYLADYGVDTLCGAMLNVLRQKGYKNLIISGSDTSLCIKESIQDAVSYGFNVCAVNNLLADNSAKFCEDKGWSGSEYVKHKSRSELMMDIKAQLIMPHIRKHSFSSRLFNSL